MNTTTPKTTAPGPTPSKQTIGPGPNGDPAPDLEIAIRLLVEATGCSRSTAAKLVDAIARYTVRKSQACLPWGWASVS